MRWSSRPLACKRQPWIPIFRQASPFSTLRETCIRVARFRGALSLACTALVFPRKVESIERVCKETVWSDRGRCVILARSTT